MLFNHKYDCKGFVDLQVNGYKGIDFASPELTVDDVLAVTHELAERGTVAYCPTLCGCAIDLFMRNLVVLGRAAEDPELGRHILGLHIEGPFISPKPGAVGAHDVDASRDASIEDFDGFQKLANGHIAIVTMAPELPGAYELIRHISDQGVAVLFGHHLADSESMRRGVEAGARGCTHLGNGLPNEIHRHDNPLWWQLASDELFSTVITDGHHVPAELIKVALRAKTTDRFVVISDAVHFGGMPAGIYDSFGNKVEVSSSGKITVYGTPYLAGSSAVMLECMNFLASLRLLSEEELWTVSLVNPMRLLGKPLETLDGLQYCPVEFAAEEGFRLRP